METTMMNELMNDNIEATTFNSGLTDFQKGFLAGLGTASFGLAVYKIGRITFNKIKAAKNNEKEREVEAQFLADNPLDVQK